MERRRELASSPTPAPTNPGDEFLSNAIASDDVTGERILIYLAIFISIMLMWMCTNMLCVGDKAALRRDEKERYLRRLNFSPDGSYGMTDVRPPKKRASAGLDRSKKKGQLDVPLRLGYNRSWGRIHSPPSLGGAPPTLRKDVESAMEEKEEQDENAVGEEPSEIEIRPPETFRLDMSRHDDRVAEQVPGSMSLFTPHSVREEYDEWDEKYEDTDPRLKRLE